MKKENSLLNYLILIIILISLSILLIISILLYGIISSNPKFTTKKLVYNIYNIIDENLVYLNNLGVYNQNINFDNKLAINNKENNFNIKTDIKNKTVKSKLNDKEKPQVEKVIYNMLSTDSNYLLTTTKKALNNNLNKNNYSVKLEKIEINKTTTYVRKITYEDNNFINNVLAELKSNKKYMDELRTLTNISNLNYEVNNFKLNIYTKGLNGAIVKIELFINNNAFTYEYDLNDYIKYSYNDKSLVLKQKDKNHYQYTYNNYQGEFNYNKDIKKFDYQLSDTNKKIKVSGVLKPAT